MVTLVERSECELCREALERLPEVQGEIPFRLVRHNVDEGMEGKAFCRDELPVVFLEDRILFREGVDPGRLRRALLERSGVKSAADLSPRQRG